MSDIFDKVTASQDFVKKILAKIPGFKGYVERADRRMSDKLLREDVANSFESLYQRISSLQRDLISQGGLAYIDDLEASAIKIRQFIDRVRTASYGYAGIFDAIKIKEDELVQTAYFYPLGLWGRIYWFILTPIHYLVFRNMIKSILQKSQKYEQTK